MDEFLMPGKSRLETLPGLIDQAKSVPEAAQLQAEALELIRRLEQAAGFRPVEPFKEKIEQALLRLFMRFPGEEPDEVVAKMRAALDAALRRRSFQP